MSLQDPFKLVSLPRVTDLDLREKVVISSIDSPFCEHVYVGISRSSISAFSLKPSPKLTWTYAISPQTIVDSLEVFEENNNARIYAFGTTERRSHKLTVLYCQNEQTNKTEVKVESKVIGIKFADDGKYAYLVLLDGRINVFNAEDANMVQLVGPSAGESTKVVHHSFFKYNEIPTWFLLVVEQSRNSSSYKTFSITDGAVLETSNVSGHDTHNLLFGFDSGILYTFNVKTFDLSSASLPNIKELARKNLSPLFDSNPTLSDCTILVPCPDRVLISYGNKFYYINFKFSSLLDSYSEGDQVYTRQIVHVKGNSLKSSSSLAVYLSRDGKNNNTDLKIININTSLNKLSECLGKSIYRRPEDDIKLKGLANLYEEDFLKQSEILGHEVQDVYDTLRECRKKKHILSWEKIVVPYLKNKDWKTIQKSLEEESFSQEYSVFEVEKDRSVDPLFIKRILRLIFDDNQGFVPEYTLIYLLTHPLFPLEYSQNNLLALLEELDKPRLLRQAVITCPNLSLKDLVLQLMNESPEIFEDVLTRIVSDFPVDRITYVLNEVIQGKQNNFNLEVILNSLVRAGKKDSWTLVQCIIDAGGLFNWPIKTINNLLDVVDAKLASISENNYYLTLTNQALSINENSRKSSKKKGSSKNLAKGEEDIIERNNGMQQQQLESILSLDSNVPKKLKDDSVNISKRVPTYSIEKIII